MHRQHDSWRTRKSAKRPFSSFPLARISAITVPSCLIQGETINQILSLFPFFSRNDISFARGIKIHDGCYHVPPATIYLHQVVHSGASLEKILNLVGLACCVNPLYYFLALPLIQEALWSLERFLGEKRNRHMVGVVYGAGSNMPHLMEAWWQLDFKKEYVKHTRETSLHHLSHLHEGTLVLIQDHNG